MGSFSLVHWLVVGAIVLLLFGGGSRLSGIGKGLGEGIKNFKKGLKDESEEDDAGKPVKRKLIEAESDDDRPKKLAAAKKVITVEVDDNDDDDAIRRKIAAQKKVASAED
jgi:sec-independent protein translocase protein TatA